MNVSIAHPSKAQAYQELILGLSAIIHPAVSKEVNVLNILAVLKEQFSFLWIGFYFVKEHQLVLGSFQGPSACTTIAYNKGVCGTAWASKTPQIVPNVHEFEGHIACSTKSNSELVLPILKDGNVIGVLDVDSEEFNYFGEEDAFYLSQIIVNLQALQLL